MIAPWAYNPVAISVAATPTLHGGPSGSPVLGPRRVILYPGAEMGKEDSHVHQASFSFDDHIIPSGRLERASLAISYHEARNTERRTGNECGRSPEHPILDHYGDLK